MAYIKWFDPYERKIEGPIQLIEGQVEFLKWLCWEEFIKGIGTGNPWLDYKIEVGYKDKVDNS